jgi:hypothetical protein
MYVSLQERSPEIRGYQAFGGRNGDQVTLTSEAFYRPGTAIEVKFIGRTDFGSELVFNPRTGAASPMARSDACLRSAEP